MIYRCFMAFLFILAFLSTPSFGEESLNDHLDRYQKAITQFNDYEKDRVQEYAKNYLAMKDTENYRKCYESTYENEHTSCALIFIQTKYNFFKKREILSEIKKSFESIVKLNPNQREGALILYTGLQGEFSILEREIYREMTKEKAEEECRLKNKPFIICIQSAEYLEMSSVATHVNKLKLEKLQKHILDLKKIIKSNPESKCSILFNKDQFEKIPEFASTNKDIIRRFYDDFDRESETRQDVIAKQKHRGPYLKTNIFQLIIDDNKGSKKICSSAQVKIEGKCHLITNEHCVRDSFNPKITLVTGVANEIVNSPSRNIEVNIKRVDAQRELVLLEAPEKFNEEFCGKIQETKINQAQDIVGEHENIVTAGYLKTGEVDLRNNYDTGELSLKNKKPLARSIPSGLKNIKNFVEVRYVDVGPGMSGGALLDENGDVLGITTRYIPLQDTPWIIPMADVKNFIDQKEEVVSKNPKLYSTLTLTQVNKGHVIGDNLPNMPGDNLPNMPGDNLPNMPGDNLPNMPGDNLPNMPGDNLPNMPGDNLPNMPGDNLPNMPGDNLPNMPGDNLPNMPGDNLPNMPGDKAKHKQNTKIEMSIFSERHEGIIDFNDSEKRKLVAVKCNTQSKWEQIDGNDDYIHKCDDVTKLSSNQKIYLAKDGFLPKTERLEMLKGFSGEYNYQKSDYFGREVVFTPNPLAIDGMQKLSSKIGKDSIEITADHISARFANKTDLDLKVSYTSDNKFIVLTKPDNTTLSCENKSLNKLICKNEKEVFSISMVNSKNNQLNYKYAIKEKEDQYRYFYGEFISK